MDYGVVSLVLNSQLPEPTHYLVEIPVEQQVLAREDFTGGGSFFFYGQNVPMATIEFGVFLLTVDKLVTFVTVGKCRKHASLFGLRIGLLTVMFHEWLKGCRGTILLLVYFHII